MDLALRTFLLGHSGSCGPDFGFGLFSKLDWLSFIVELFTEMVMLVLWVGAYLETAEDVVAVSFSLLV